MSDDASPHSFNPAYHPHRRRNPLTGQWVLVSPHRLQRPWQGQIDPPQLPQLPAFDADCPLCPGNPRAGNNVTPKYDQAYVFENDFAAMQADTPQSRLPYGADESRQNVPPSLFQQASVRGAAKVLCFSPAHNKTLPELSVTEIQAVVSSCVEQVNVLSKSYAWVQIFENKGSMMGCSQPHPHAQIWASDFVPEEVSQRDERLAQYQQAQGTNLLVDYVAQELALGERLVIESDHWVAVVPYWATWPFETMLLPKTHVARFDDLDSAQQADLGVALKRLLTCYDNLFNTSFPYSMGWYYAPFASATEHWQLHAVFYPPLLRSATVRKFMVGYEMLAGAQRDLTAEQAAERLRSTSAKHYKLG